jgi:hypothetical protein
LRAKDTYPQILLKINLQTGLKSFSVTVMELYIKAQQRLLSNIKILNFTSEVQISQELISSGFNKNTTYPQLQVLL